MRRRKIKLRLSVPFRVLLAYYYNLIFDVFTKNDRTKTNHNRIAQIKYDVSVLLFTVARGSTAFVLFEYHIMLSGTYEYIVSIVQYGQWLRKINIYDYCQTHDRELLEMNSYKVKMCHKIIWLWNRLIYLKRLLTSDLNIIIFTQLSIKYEKNKQKKKKKHLSFNLIHYRKNIHLNESWLLLPAVY